MLALKDKRIFVANSPIDFRLGLQGLSDIVMNENAKIIHDGSVYVFYNNAYDKIKLLMWDTNGFVLFYKKLDNLKFKVQLLQKKQNTITAEQLERLLAGQNPIQRLDHNVL